REGVAAILTFAPIGLYAIYWIFLGQNNGLPGLIGIVAALACIITVYCTSMIYASLKTIPAWSNPWTPIAYIALALGTGGAIAALLMALWRYPAAEGVAMGAAAMMAVALFVKLAYWNSVSIAPARSTAETATGLGAFGSVKLIDGPHSQSNYLLEEMGFKIARKHAAKLRRIAILAGFAAPIILLALAAFAAPALAILLLLLAVAAGAVGIAAERWLFFAEAKHVVTLYYGESRV
ncbi:MAG: DmsC/YnfH family molybdoenzyme membrane anchor subunit, partial [Parvularculaceae bacterium]